MKYSLRTLFEVDKILEGSQKRKPKKVPIKTVLYCDMDGVLCDFQSRFEHLTGLHPREYEAKYGKNNFWKFIDETVGEVFWSEMDWTPSGKKLWEFIGKYSPSLLTSPSRNEVSRTGKQKWVTKNLSPTPKIYFRYSQEKKELATPITILIDDRKDIIDSWKKTGGIGIHHPENTRNISPIIEKLKELGYE